MIPESQEIHISRFHEGDLANLPWIVHDTGHRIEMRVVLDRMQ